MKNQDQHVHVALSGGVDSAVAAHLLKEQGYRVTGVFMKNWSGEDFGLEDSCPWREDQEMAEAICNHLGIPFKTYNFEKEYRELVIENFFSEYERGNTPNPDILCNQFIKFGSFLEKSQAEGAELIATGHYARKSEDGGTLQLKRSADQSKDQTYFLYRITQHQLSHILFPLGDLKKDEVRKIASNIKLPNADKKDSQGICFIGRINVQDFLRQKIQPREGDIIDIDTNNVIGKHQGVWYYTYGQREGLRIGGAKKPYFVANKDVKNNILYVASGRDNPRLYCTEVQLSNLHWITKKPKDGEYLAMIRYRQKPTRCTLNNKNIAFLKPIWNPSPGQSAVILKNKTVLGGGTIEIIEG